MTTDRLTVSAILCLILFTLPFVSRADSDPDMEAQARKACAHCKHGYSYSDGKCECSGDAPQAMQQFTDPLYKYAKAWQEYWEGAKTRKVVDLYAPEQHEPLQFVLTQIVNGHAVFHYSGSGANPIARFTIAVKKSSLGSVTLSPGMSIGTAAKCLKFIKNQTWENEAGFPLEVKTYTATKCAK